MIIAGVVCDRCGELIYWEHAPKKDIIKWARKGGYSIGKQTLCLDCRKGHKKEDEHDKE